MGRKSTKPDKTIYQTARENAGFTRAQASEALDFITESRIERIEYGSLPLPEEVIAMSRAYKMPELCNFFCAHECAIGKETVEEVDSTASLSDIVLNILASLNTLTREKDRLIEITVDGVISEDEASDFDLIRDKLNEMSQTIDALKLWLEKNKH